MHTQTTLRAFVEGLFAIVAQSDKVRGQMFGMIWMAAAPNNGGGNIMKFSVELTVEETLILLALFTAAVHLANQ